jgi:hypothetical protein
LMVRVPRARAKEESVRMCILAGRLAVLLVAGGRRCGGRNDVVINGRSVLYGELG